MIVPNQQAAVLEAQSVLMSSDISALSDGSNSNGVISGCAVSAQASPDMTVAVALGLVCVNGTISKVTAGNLTVTAANSTNPRIDIVTIDSSGTKVYTAGTAAATPVMPDIPSNSVLLARIDVPANATAVNAVASNDGKAKLTDKRVFVSVGGIIARLTSNVTVSNTTTESTLMSITVPANLMGTNRAVRMTIWGDYLNNSGSNTTFTLRVKFGSTTFFGDASGNVGTSSTRRPFTLTAVVMNKGATNAQSCMFECMLGNAASGSVAGLGDMAAAGYREFNGTNGTSDMAIDTTADASFTTTIAHASAASTMEIVIRGGFVELL